MIRKSQAEQFHEQGYLVVDQAIEFTQLTRLRAAALEIVEQFDIDRHRSIFSTRDRDSGRDEYFYESAERVHCFLEEDALDKAGNLTCPKHLAINKIGHAMHDLHPVFTAFCRQAFFSSALRSLGYSAPVLWQTMYIFKQPGIGGEVRWHQDASYLITNPSNVTGIWVAIEDANQDNGCLWVQPGGHRGPLREIFEVDQATGNGTLRSLDTSPWPDDETAVPVEVAAGSVVLFDDHMPHYSSQNHSTNSRHAFTMHVAEKDACWDARNWLQRPTLGHFAL